MHDQPESPPISVPPAEPVVENGVPALGGVTLKVPEIGRLRFEQPRPNAQRLQRLIDTDPCLTRLKAKLSELECKQLPTRLDYRDAWRKVEAAFREFLNLKYQADWAKETRTIILAEMERRKIVIRDKEEARVGHQIRMHLGGKYHRFFEENVKLEKPEVKVDISNPPKE